MDEQAGNAHEEHAAPGNPRAVGVESADTPRRQRRAARPCDACRRRKSRCIVKGDDGPGGICTMCELRESSCTFVGRPEARRRPVQTSAAAAAATMLAPAAVTPLSSMQAVLSDSSVSPAAAPPTWRSGSEQRGNAGIPSPSRGTGAQGRPATEASGSVGEERHRFAELYGLTSDMEPILMKHRPYNAANDEYRLETHGMRRVQTSDSGMAYPVVFHVVSDARAVGHADDDYDAEADEIHALVDPWGARLVRLYWLLVQPAYPILHQQGFMRAWEASHRNVHPALLGAVYLKAIDWWSYDSELSLRAPPDTVKLRRLTMRAIQNSYHRPRLSSVMAMLVYLHCAAEDPLVPDHTFTRGLTSQMLTVGEALGLHLDASAWSIPSWEKGVRKRLSWGIYMQDKWTAVAYGRPSHVNEEDWGVLDLEDSDFEHVPEDGGGAADMNSAPDPPTTVRMFRLMVDLSKILSRILTAFYTVRSSRDQDTARLLDRAQPFFQELAAWQASLLAELPLTSSQPRRLSPRGYVYLCYYGLLINISRRLVRSTALAPLCSDQAVLFAIRQQASQTALEATNFVSSLRLDQLESFWYFPSPYLFALIGSFQVLLLVTSVSSPERDYWREMLTSYLWTTRVMSKTSGPLKYAVNRLEGGILRGMEHALAVHVDSQLPGMAEASDLTQILHQLESEQFAYSGFADIGVGLQDIDWLHGVQI